MLPMLEAAIQLDENGGSILEVVVGNGLRDAGLHGEPPERELVRPALVEHLARDLEELIVAILSHSRRLVEGVSCPGIESSSVTY